MSLPPFICIRKMDIDIDFALATKAGKDALRQRADTVTGLFRLA
jgi:hypothetical protein